MIVPGSANPLMWGNSDPLDELGKVDRSVRTRSSASAYFSRTFGAAGNRTTNTVSLWIKRCSIAGAIQTIMSGGSSQRGWLYFDTNQRLTFDCFGSSAVWQEPNARRDPLSHAHVQFVTDTNNANAADRWRVYYNGLRITPSGYSAPALGASPQWFDNALHSICRENNGATYFGDQVVSSFAVVDGKALDPTVFGQFHPLTRQWRPKTKSAIRAGVAVGGGARNGWGAEGSFLPFDDATSPTTLGYDRSQSDSDTTGNNWTPNNISVTAGATYDALTDTPTTNYCTLNPLMPGISSVGTVSNAALTFSYGPSDITGQMVGTFSLQSFKAYYEASLASLSVGNGGNNVHAFGFRSLANSTTRLEYGYLSDGSIMRHSLRYMLNGSQISRVNIDTVAPASTDTLGFAFDSDAGIATAYKNGVQVAQITGISTAIADWTPHIARDGTANGGTWHLNFGQRPFASTPPSGFKALSAKNLPRPAGAVLKPWEHFDTLLYSGTGAARDVTGTAFSPDYVMGKDRSAARDFFNYSRSRGVTKYLAANLTSAEQTLANGLTAFLSNGFSVGSDANSNGNAESFVAWLLKAGGAPVANNAGSVASMVSANPLAGISIVTWNGSGAASATIGHGLPTAPKFILIKNRLGVGTAEWLVGHDALGWGDYVLLSSQGARVTASNRWNNTAPGASVFTVGALPNAAGESYEAICIAEVPGFSKVFGFNGNSSSDGPNPYLGFLPAFTLLKNATSIYDWYTHDAKRSPYNGSMLELYPAGNSIEGSGVGREFDYVSNGLKIRNSNSGHNASGSLYIGLAFAQSSFRYSNAR